MLNIHKSKFPGTVAQGTAPSSVWCDNGGEIRRVYAEHVVDAGGEFLHSIEGRPKSNARTERYHQTFGGCVKACLKQANGPLRMSAPCARHTTVNLNRVPDNRGDGESPFVHRKGRETGRLLVPWGCGAILYDENAEKMSYRFVHFVTPHPSRATAKAISPLVPRAIYSKQPMNSLATDPSIPVSSSSSCLASVSSAGVEMIINARNDLWDMYLSPTGAAYT